MFQLPPVTFQNGHQCPNIGLGTWKSNTDEVGNVVKQAIDIGYRHFDCALGYANEKEIGTALQEKLKDGSIKREDIFITSKVWMTYNRPEKVEEACRQTLKDLQLNYLDLYLIHWPVSVKEGPELYPFDSDGKHFIIGTTDYVDTWKAMQSLVDKGLTRSIGVSNFNIKQLQRLLSLNLPHGIATLQVEVHPYLNNKKVVEFCKDNGISVTAYSPLGSRDSPFAPPDSPILLEDATVASIAETHNRTPAQVLLRWSLQRGCAVIPKTVTFHRLQENLNLIDFCLTEDDMAQLNSLNRNLRLCGGAALETSEYYPFKDGEDQET